MTLRTGLKKSKNMVSIRILQAIGTQYAQDWITRFGFEADKHPAYLTMALGAGSVTPMQMLLADEAIADSGSIPQPILVKQVSAPDGSVIKNESGGTLFTPISASAAAGVRTAMTAVVQRGTGVLAQIPGVSIAGKTGTAETSGGGGAGGPSVGVLKASGSSATLDAATSITVASGGGGGAGGHTGVTGPAAPAGSAGQSASVLSA